MAIYRLLFIYFLLFLTGNSYGQTDLDKTVIKYLDKSSTVKEIDYLVSTLDKDFSRYKTLFNYIPSINPLNPKNQKRISSKFGKRFHPIQKKIKAHFGLDISAAAGTPIHSAADGTVFNVINSNTGYGKQVFIKHEHGYASRYAHMYMFIVKKGAKVKKGDVIGFVGSTGASTGNHLHFEILKNGKPIDPYPFCFLKLKK